MKAYKEGVIVGGDICTGLKVYPASINVPAFLSFIKCEDLENNKEFDEFVQSKYAEDKSTRILINEYRIDNWLKEILSR